MINIPDITAYMGSFLWTLFRVAAMITMAPVFGSRTVPARVKLGLAVVLTVVIVPIVPMPEPVSPLSADAVLITIQQIIIGTALGLALQFVFAMFVIGGQVIAYQMGLGFSKMVDPQSGTQVPVVSQFYIIVLTLVFFALNGHLTLIKVLAESFTSLPISTHGLSLESMWTLIQWSGNMYVAGIQIALPAIASIMLVNFTFAVVTRSAPQFNIFSIGFPMTMVIGFFIISVTLSGVLPQIKHQFTAVFELMKSLVFGG